MPQSYIITFKGKTQNISIRVDYDDTTGLLRRFDVLDQEGLDHLKLQWVMERTPSSLNRLGEADQFGIVEEVPQDLSFNAFWEAYGNKVNCDRAYKFWLALPSEDRVAALRAIPKYSRYLDHKSGIEKKYPDTWLKNRCWNDNYTIK